MKNFEHVTIQSVEDIFDLLDPETKIIAGGTDLLVEMKEGRLTPKRLLNIKEIPQLQGIACEKGSGITIGALATLAEIEENPIIRTHAPVLAQAASVAASPQLRNTATIGGNLCQTPRCWYYSGPFKCLLKGGEKCYAVDGENGQHAIFGGDPCYAVNPSDLAPALMALNAILRTISPMGERAVQMDRFFADPWIKAPKLHSLADNEIILQVFIPEPPKGSKSVYIKAMDRKTWSFALASVALSVNETKGKIEDARLILGSVAPKPWRCHQAERILQGNKLTQDIIERAADSAVSDAKPLSGNRYKIQLTKALVRRGLQTVGTAA